MAQFVPFPTVQKIGAAPIRLRLVNKYVALILNYLHIIFNYFMYDSGGSLKAWTKGLLGRNKQLEI